VPAQLARRRILHRRLLANYVQHASLFQALTHFFCGAGIEHSAFNGSILPRRLDNHARETANLLIHSGSSGIIGIPDKTTISPTMASKIQHFDVALRGRFKAIVEVLERGLRIGGALPAACTIQDDSFHCL